jgi:hypothetical protein
MPLEVYDHLLTLHLEIALVWYQSRWTYTKILFLMARYFPYPGVFLFLYSECLPFLANIRVLTLLEF